MGTKMNSDYLKLIQYCKNNLADFDISILTNNQLSYDAPYSEFEIALIQFLMLRDRPEQVVMLSGLGRKYSVVFDQDTGSLYNGSKNNLIIYVGRCKDTGFRCIFVSGDSGISTVSDSVELPETAVAKIGPEMKIRESNLNLKFYRCSNNSSIEVWKNMEFLWDCLIKCRDGYVSANKWHLCSLSPFFLQYVTKYQPDNEIYLLEKFDKVIFEAYLHFNVYGELNREFVYDRAEELLDIGMFMMDEKLIHYVYDGVWESCDDESLRDLNACMREYFNIKY